MSRVTSNITYQVTTATGFQDILKGAVFKNDTSSDQIHEVRNVCIIPNK